MTSLLYMGLLLLQSTCTTGRVNGLVELNCSKIKIIISLILIYMGGLHISKKIENAFINTVFSWVIIKKLT